MKATLYRGVVAKSTLVPAARTDGTVNGVTVDRHDGKQDYRSAMVVIHTGAITDGTHTFEVQHSDASGSGFAAVPDSDLEGTEPEIGSSDDNEIHEIGYLGSKRYLRVSVTTADSSTGGVFGAVILLGQGRRSVSR